jgi:predicted DNA-binding protein
MQERIAKSKPRMVRKQIFIDAAQNRRLKAAAAAAGRSEADLVREGLERTLADLEASAEDWRTRMAEVLAEGDPMDALAARVVEHKKNKAEAWRKRLERNRKRAEEA